MHDSTQVSVIAQDKKLITHGTGIDMTECSKLYVHACTYILLYIHAGVHWMCRERQRIQGVSARWHTALRVSPEQISGEVGVTRVVSQ